MDRRRTWGIGLLVIALLALFNRYLPYSTEQLVVPLLGVGFVAWAAMGRVQGLLIPGGILLGVGLGQWLPRLFAIGAGTATGQVLFLGCLATGFLLITLLSLALFRSRLLWPLWPAAFLGLAAVLRLIGPAWQNFGWRMQAYWPFALLVIAIWLLAARPGARNK